MDTKTCACGCGQEISADNSWKYKRGHKPKVSQKKLTAGSTLAKRPEPVIIDAAVEEDDTVYVDCQISVPQLDTIFSLLQPYSKAMAVLNGLSVEAE
jgi:hypothetical protein